MNYGDKNKSTIVSFRDLNAWKEGHQLVLSIYKVVKSFPKDEKFILTSQILRAVISITSNIAEGFARHGIKDKVHFYNIAQASLVEVQNQIIIAKDLEYISPQEFDVLWNESVIVHKLITGLTKSIKMR